MSEPSQVKEEPSAITCLISVAHKSEEELFVRIAAPGLFVSPTKTSRSHKAASPLNLSHRKSVSCLLQSLRPALTLFLLDFGSSIYISIYYEQVWSSSSSSGLCGWVASHNVRSTGWIVARLPAKIGLIRVAGQAQTSADLR